MLMHATLHDIGNAMLWAGPQSQTCKSVHALLMPSCAETCACARDYLMLAHALSVWCLLAPAYKPSTANYYSATHVAQEMHINA